MTWFPHFENFIYCNYIGLHYFFEAVSCDLTELKSLPQYNSRIESYGVSYKYYVGSYINLVCNDTGYAFIGVNKPKIRVMCLDTGTWQRVDNMECQRKYIISIHLYLILLTNMPKYNIHHLFSYNMWQSTCCATCCYSGYHLPNDFPRKENPNNVLHRSG